MIKATRSISHNEKQRYSACFGFNVVTREGSMNWKCMTILSDSYEGYITHTFIFDLWKVADKQVLNRCQILLQLASNKSHGNKIQIVLDVTVTPFIVPGVCPLNILVSGLCPFKKCIMQTTFKNKKNMT